MNEKLSGQINFKNLFFYQTIAAGFVFLYKKVVQCASRAQFLYCMLTILLNPAFNSN